MYFFCVGRRQIKEADNPVVNIMTNFSILTSGIAVVSMKTSGIFIGRLISYGSVYSASILSSLGNGKYFYREFGENYKKCCCFGIYWILLLSDAFYMGAYMKNPEISVIMGIYNCADTLSEAIESVLGQTMSEWELIMCDDGSSDATS